MITTAAYITTDAIKLAMDHNIDIIFLDKFGGPFGRVWHSKLGSTTLIQWQSEIDYSCMHRLMNRNQMSNVKT